MEELKQKAAFALETLKALGADDAQVSVVRGDVEEYTVDAGEFSLIRSVFSQSISMKVIKDHKKGAAAVNQLEDDAIREAAAECMAAAQSGAEDDAVAIADKEENADFEDGALTPDKARFFDSLIQFTEVNQWNGQLPVYVSGDAADTVPVLNMNQLTPAQEAAQTENP